MRKALTALIICCVVLCARVGHAQESARVTAAVLRFADALAAGDASQLRQMISIDDGSGFQRRGRDLFVELVQEEKRLEKASTQRWSAAGARLSCGFAEIVSTKRRSAMERAQPIVDESGFSARVLVEGDSTPIRLRRASDGRWQLRLDIIEDMDDQSAFAPPYSTPQQRLEYYGATLDALKGAADRVERGEVENAVAVETALLAELAAARARIFRRDRRSIDGQASQRGG